MKILITGAAGFIGMNLAKSLLERGNTVIGVDNLNDYYDVQLKEKRNLLLQEYCNYHFYLCDIANQQEIENIFNTHNINTLVHLAAQAGVRYSIKNPHAYIHSNVTGFINLLECCHKNNVPKVIYASTSNVYGTSKEYPYKENAILNTPSSVYGVSKICSELLAHAYSHLYDTQMIGLRFFSVYGPWGRPDMALYIFTKNILNDVPIDIYNNGEMWRDFTYVDDIVEGIRATIDSTTLEKYEIFNIGNNKSEYLMDMIHILEKSLAKKAIKNFMPMQQGDSEKSYACTDKAKNKLKFRSFTNIEKGIPKFVEWYQKFYIKKDKI